MPRKKDPPPPPSTATLLEGIADLTASAFRLWILLCVMPMDVLAGGRRALATHMGWPPSSVRADLRELEDAGYVVLGAPNAAARGARAIGVARRPILVRDDLFVKLSIARR